MNIRHYETPPEEKSLHTCWSHGSDHKEYGHTRQIDPRWSPEQVKWYLKGYEGEKAPLQLSGMMIHCDAGKPK